MRILNIFKLHRHKHKQVTSSPRPVQQTTAASSGSSTASSAVDTHTMPIKAAPAPTPPAAVTGPLPTLTVKPSAPPPSHLKGVARVQREYRDLLAGKVCTEGYSDLQLVDDNVMRWSINLKLDEGPDECILATALRNSKNQGHSGLMHFRIDFPKNYPAQPPFVWLQSPRLEFQTGFISRGAVCMEMLVVTGGNYGWKSDYTLESVLQTLRANLQVPQAYGLIHSWTPYTEVEARGGLERARQGHKSGGWVS